MSVTIGSTVFPSAKVARWPSQRRKLVPTTSGDITTLAQADVGKEQVIIYGLTAAEATSMETAFDALASPGSINLGWGSLKSTAVDFEATVTGNTAVVRMRFEDTVWDAAKFATLPFATSPVGL